MPMMDGLREIGPRYFDVRPMITPGLHCHNCGTVILLPYDGQRYPLKEFDEGIETRDGVLRKPYGVFIFKRTEAEIRKLTDAQD